MTKYQEILTELKSGTCSYGNCRIVYLLQGCIKMYEQNGESKMQFFTTLQQMARSINKFYKTGY